MADKRKVLILNDDPELVALMMTIPATMHTPVLLASSSLRHLEPDLLRDKAILVLVRPYDADEMLLAIERMLSDGTRRSGGA